MANRSRSLHIPKKIDREIGSLLSQSKRDGPADPARSAGNESYFALKLQYSRHCYNRCCVDPNVCLNSITSRHIS